MALINCPECTHTISDQSVTCPSCGLPASKMHFLIECPECSESISNQSISCTNCGFPIVKPETFKDIPPSPEELKELKLLKELEELEENEESIWTEPIGIFILIVIYFMSKDEIDYILQHVIGLFSR